MSLPAGLPVHTVPALVLAPRRAVPRAAAVLPRLRRGPARAGAGAGALQPLKASGRRRGLLPGGGFFGFEAREDTPPEPDYPYSVFGLPRCSSDDDVKRAYREAVLKAHPDKGGDAELFRRVREAWEHFTTFCRV